MPANALPVRPQPFEGEPLTAYVPRLMTANGVSTRWPSELRDVNVPAVILRQVAELSGLGIERIQEMTLDQYPVAVRGRARRGAWRLDADTRWMCHRCTHTTGHLQLLWQFALHPVCEKCRHLLTATPGPGDRVAAPADLIQLQQTLIADLKATPTSSAARLSLSRFRRLTTLIAWSIDDQWPPRADGLPPVDQDNARKWARFPSSDPCTVAHILLAASPGLASRNGFQRLREEGYQRLELPEGRSASRYLPKRPRTVPTPPQRRTRDEQPDPRDLERLEWLTTKLAHHIQHDGLRVEHLPVLLPTSQDHGLLPPAAQWRDRYHASIVLHVLINRAGGNIGSVGAACRSFGVPDNQNSVLLDTVRLDHGFNEPQRDLLLDGIKTLLDAGLIDYQWRRDCLRGLRRLAPSLLRVLPHPQESPYPLNTLARGWVWMHLTNGPMCSSPWPLVPDHHVRAFGALLDPEASLVLLEAGETQLHEIAFLPMGRDVLAQHIAANLEAGACKDHAAQWNQWETTYEQSTNRAARLQALNQPLSYCTSCAITAACAEWARTNRYTGIAGGHALVEGRPDGRLRPRRTRAS